MLDRRLFLEDLGSTKRKLARKGVDPAVVDEVHAALVESKARITERDQARAALKQASRAVEQAKRGEGDLERALEEARRLKQESELLDAESKRLADDVQRLLLTIPNLPDDSCPDGKSEADNVVVEVKGYEPTAFEGRLFRPHWEIGEEFGILDARRAAALSGSMFALLRNDGARLLRALVNFVLDLNRNCYEEIIPPHLVSTEVLTSTGHLPKFADDAYRMADDDLWAISTGEIPLTSMHRGEVLDMAELPKRYMAYTVCWRREAGAAGRDTRGLQRLHEFHKVELVQLCAPEQIQHQFEELLSHCLQPITLLGLPYRILDLCAGDLTFSSQRIYDIEVYAPGADRWLEVSSVGIFGDFQTRRGNSRFRRERGSRPELLHSLNGSGLATPRVWAAIIENGQRDDGSIEIPEVLRPYMGGKEHITKSS